jgi:uncharacterized beta-barrel protein YwiB (DUF1934 family)
MKEKNLCIRDSQTYETHQDKNEVIVHAKIGEKNGTHMITFSQTDGSLNGVIRTVIKVKEGVIKVTREGALSNVLVFDILKPYETLYRTPYGDMAIKIHTKRMHTILDDERLFIEIAYEIFVQESKISDNIYTIYDIDKSKEQTR